MENEKNTAAGKSNLRTLIILVSIWFLICCFIASAGYGGYFYINSSVEKAKAATATAHGIATSAVATSHAFATSTGISHATEIAGYEIYDNFDSNPHSWETGVENNDYWYGAINISKGLYTWDIRKIKDPGAMSWRGYDQNLAQDFDLSVDARLANGPKDLLCYGVAFRVSPVDLDNGAYLFSVCDSGMFEVEYNNEVDGSETIVPWTRSEAIRSDRPNTISVSARGEDITLLINNTVVQKFTDKHVLKGEVYLLGRIFGDQPGTIQFDNFAFQPR